MVYHGEIELMKTLLAVLFLVIASDAFGQVKVDIKTELGRTKHLRSGPLSLDTEVNYFPIGTNGMAVMTVSPLSNVLTGHAGDIAFLNSGAHNYWSRLDATLHNPGDI